MHLHVPHPRTLRPAIVLATTAVLAAAAAAPVAAAPAATAISPSAPLRIAELACRLFITSCSTMPP